MDQCDLLSKLIPVMETSQKHHLATFFFFYVCGWIEDTGFNDPSTSRREGEKKSKSRLDYTGLLTMLFSLNKGTQEDIMNL